MIGRHVLRRAHEPEFAYFSRFAGERRLFLDVGANAGQSALSFRRYNKTCPILAIEPNRYHEADLRLVKRLIRDFDYMMFAAGAETGETVLFLPTYRGVPLTGEASVVPEEAGSYWRYRHLGSQSAGSKGDQFRIEEVRVPVRKLDELGLDPGFIKIDVERAELEVLRGLLATLQRSRPILLLERTGDLPSITSFLQPLGYLPFAYDRERDTLVEYADQAVLNVFYLLAVHPR